MFTSCFVSMNPTLMTSRLGIVSNMTGGKTSLDMISFIRSTYPNMEIFAMRFDENEENIRSIKQELDFYRVHRVIGHGVGGIMLYQYLANDIYTSVEKAVFWKSYPELFWKKNLFPCDYRVFNQDVPTWLNTKARTIINESQDLEDAVDWLVE